MFGNGTDNTITAMTACQMSLQGKVWKKRDVNAEDRWKVIGRKMLRKKLSVEQSENS